MAEGALCKTSLSLSNFKPQQARQRSMSTSTSSQEFSWVSKQGSHHVKRMRQLKVDFLSLTTSQTAQCIAWDAMQELS